ncbi:MAG: RNA-binding S4 domain-containing protein [Deltaproteobacteria bacterium]|nr:RNA-binding S4 domain-containing protein [Deltaproteobacteria bacterium]
MEGSVRLDKWLHKARIFKTRTRAHLACEERRVTVNGEIAKSAKSVKLGDQITVTGKTRSRVLHVLGVVLKTVPANEAKELYREETVCASEDNPTAAMPTRGKPARLSSKRAGRPTKKERRSLTKVRGY